ncbi:MAG: hypothetical protein EBZ48_03880 [Proteobacteria bacterium]|nr:hypothetical protein [Pseudomonadota bacterium]
MRSSICAVIALGLCASSLVGPASESYAETLDSSVTALVSRGTYSGAPQSNGASVNPRVSRNGRFVVFESVSNNLVEAPSITPGRRHVYLLDRQSGTIELISKTRTGPEAADDSYSPSVSADGRYVAFASDAPVTSLVSVCQGGCNVEIADEGTHVYVRDRLANKTSLVSQVTLPIREAAFDESGAVRNQLTEDDPLIPGRKRPKMTIVNRRVAAYIIDLDTFATSAATSSNPVISADGRYVAYDTDANTVAGVGTKFKYRDLIGSDDDPGSGDYDYNTGLLYIPDLQLRPEKGWRDTNGVRDVFTRDGSLYTNYFVDLECKYHFPQGCAIGGTSDSVKPSISDDGTVVSFETATPFLSLDFNGVRDVFKIKLDKLTGEVAELTRVSNTTSRILAPSAASTGVSISGDGRFAAFESTASNLVSGDTNGASDVFVYDSKFFAIARCVLAGGVQANAAVTRPSISGDGKYITMESAATNWGAPGGSINIYLATINRTDVGALSGCTVELASVGSGTGGNNNSTFSGISIVPRIISGELSSAPAVVYQSLATNLSTSADTNGFSDIFQSPFCSATDLSTDSDGDGTSECFDQCPSDQTKVEDADSDGDGSPNCTDNCPNDASKLVPGGCGCGVPDTDTDGDGKPDCQDGCPQDSNKSAPGVCGCGFVDTDSNGNGTADCNESQIPTPTPGATATPAPTATPISVINFVPAAPVVTRQSATSYLVNMSGSGASFTVSKYIVQLFRVTSSGNKYVKQKVSTSPQAVLIVDKKGPYKVRYSVQAGFQKSKVSPFSGTFTAQHSRIRTKQR